MNINRYPVRLTPQEFFPTAYRYMYLSRALETAILDLFQHGKAKGTVTSSVGNEATSVAMTLPFRPARDVVCLLHRDLAGHMVLGAEPFKIVCQYMANSQSITHARIGNVHHGDVSMRRMPMLSHLGRMFSVGVGGTWFARKSDPGVFGLVVTGDGASSTGEFHESLNIASVKRVPVLFVAQNNGRAISTPSEGQYHCKNLSDRAAGYGIPGRTIDGTDAWQVYEAVCDALDWMRENTLPYLLECRTLRIQGHAAYDKAEYVPEEERERNRREDPMPKARQRLLEFRAEDGIRVLERSVDEEVKEMVERALKVARPEPQKQVWSSFAESHPPLVQPYKAQKVKNGDAFRAAMGQVMSNHPESFIIGLDVGAYGSAFKVCKGFHEIYGSERVVDMPLAEAGMLGMALGASQVGGKPLMEFQFADFSTEAATQLGINVATWFYRSDSPVPMVVRLPCGGGIGMGAFHSGEYEGVWSRFEGLKCLYPATAQECYEAILAAFYDPNPCLVFEHKLLYWSRSGDIDFDGDVAKIWRARRYTEGSGLTLVAFGAMVHESLSAAAKFDGAVEVWNPFAVQPMDIDPIVESVERTGRLLVVQESGETRGLGDRVISLVVRKMGCPMKCPPRLVSAPEVPIPCAPELETYCRPNAAAVAKTIEEMLAEGS